MVNKKFSLEGVLPPMITPFKQDGKVDSQAIIHNIEKWNNANLAGVLVNGSNSEAAYLNRAERLEILQLVVKHADPTRHIMAGTGCESLQETFDFTYACADLGAQSALVLTPSYYKDQMTSTVLINFFSKLADKSPIPILIYNVPKFTQINVKADLVEALSQHPNIVGMKDSTGDISQLVSFLRVADKSFQILVGTASVWYPALTLGVKAGILALANSYPDECAMVQEAYEQGDHVRAKSIYTAVFLVNRAVTASYGIQGLKYACDQKGFKGGYVRSPLMDVSEKDKQAIQAILDTADRELQMLSIHGGE